MLRGQAHATDVPHLCVVNTLRSKLNFSSKNLHPVARNPLASQWRAHLPPLFLPWFVAPTPKKKPKWVLRFNATHFVSKSYFNTIPHGLHNKNSYSSITPSKVEIIMIIIIIPSPTSKSRKGVACLVTTLSLFEQGPGLGWLFKRSPRFTNGIYWAVHF